MRCAFRGFRKVMSGGTWTQDPYRCPAEGTAEDPEVPGDWYCPKHVRVQQRRGLWGGETENDTETSTR